MKAIHKVFIVALLFVGTTGFGLTTTDLSQNSEPEIVICDQADSNSVDLVISEMDFSFDLSIVVVHQEDIPFNDFLKTKELDHSIYVIDDVGWQRLKASYDYKDLRCPRDGLNRR